MADRKTIGGSRQRDLAALVAPHLTFATLALATAAVAFLAVSFVPSSLLLPVVSLTAVAAAAVTGFVAWTCRARAGGNTITLWDVAGASALIGCAAAMLSKPENILHVFGQSLVP